MKIPLPADFDLGWTLEFLAARTVPSLESVTGEGYLRSVRVGGQPVTLAIRPKKGRGGGSSLEVQAAPALKEAELRRLIVRLFDLDADLAGFRAMAAGDPVLRDLVPKRPAIRLPQFLDPFEGVARAVLGQQVSLAAAATMLDRIVRLFAEPAPSIGGSGFLAFPAPSTVVEAGPSAMTSIGLTRAKASALHGIAAAVLDGRLDWERLRAGTAEESHAAMVALPGIGPWTASYVRMRTLGDRDAFPASDLGVIKALRVLTPQGDKITLPEITALGERWRPWRAYATLHLWNSL